MEENLNLFKYHFNYYDPEGINWQYTDRYYDAYIAKMRMDRMWGDDVECHVAAKYYNCTVTVYIAGERQSYPPLIQNNNSGYFSLAFCSGNH